MEHEIAPQSLRELAASGVVWSTVLTIVKQSSQIVVTIVLARLLTPSEYGLAAMAFVLSGFVLTLSDASLGKALVQRAAIDELDRSTVFWTTVGIGAALTAVGIVTAPYVANGLFHEPRLEPLVAVLSVGFVLVSLQMTQAALFQRQMNFRAISIRLIGGTLVAGVIGIAAAVLGAGAWALIAQELAFTATSTSLLWIQSEWRPRFMFSWSRLRVLSGFGLRVMGSRLVDNVSQNTDTLLIGRFLGSGALGVYSVAYNLVMLPITRLIVQVSESLFPVYSRIQNDVSRIGRIWLRTTTLVASLATPMMVGLIIVAPEFMRVVFGARWGGAVTVVRILAPIAIMLAVAQVSVSVLLALGRSRVVFWYSLASLPLTVASFSIGLHWGVNGVALAYTCAVIPLSLFIMSAVMRSLALGIAEVLRPMRRVGEATAIMTAATCAAHWYLRSRSAHPSAVLGICVLVGACAYVPACMLRVEVFGEEVTRIVARTRSRLGFSPQAPASSIAAD